jgi:hypothetical protein
MIIKIVFLNVFVKLIFIYMIYKLRSVQTLQATRLRWAGNSDWSVWYKCLIEKLKVENIKHKPNSKSQAGATADSGKIAENLMSSQPIANAVVELATQHKKATSQFADNL